MTETLVIAYQIYDCLWNLSSPDYKNQTKKSLCLEKIDEVMGDYGTSRNEYLIG